MKRVTAGHDDHEHPAFSPDGRWLAFTAGPYGATDLYLVDRRGRFARRLTGGPGAKTQAAWSPDGARIAFAYERVVPVPGGARRARGAPAIHVLPALERVEEAPPDAAAVETAPEGAMLLGRANTIVRQPAWSPDGRLIAYSTDEGSPGRCHLALFDLERGAREQLTEPGDRNDCHPAWSADGRRLAFHRYEGLEADRARIHVLDMTTRETRAVTGGKGFSKHPSFAAPDLLLFHREADDREPWLFALDLARGRERRLGPGKHACAVTTRRRRVRVAFAARDEGRTRRGPGGVRATFDLFTAELAMP